MAMLRNGTVTADRRLDRCTHFDERSRKFPIRQLVAQQKPRSYTWRCNATLDQGPDGACVGFGVAHELIARPSEVKNVDARFAKELIYWAAQKIDPWDGGSYPGASPQYEGTDVLSGVKIAKALGYCDEFRWSFSFEDFLLGLSYHGPAIIGINWHDGMFEPDVNNYIYPRGSIAGGHCTLINRIDVTNERVRLHNSWGPDWGLDGEAWVRWSDMDALLADEGEACFLVHRHTNPKP
jgi:hypothetical protein